MRLFLLFCLALSLSAFAEEGKGSLYIVKVNGDTVYGPGTVKERVFSPNMIYINGDSIKVTDVAILKNEYGYFRHPQVGFGKEKLALRTYDGKVIDKYTMEQTGFSGAPGQTGFAGGPGMSMSTWRVGLYTKNDGDLKEIDYDNVKADLWDNKGSRAMIEIFERKRRLQWWSLVGGIVAVLVSAPLAGDSPAVAAPLSIAGTIGLGMAIYHGTTKGKYIFKAVEHYSE